MIRHLATGVLALAVLFVMPAAALAQARTATFTIPAAVSFTVTDVSRSTSGNPTPFRVIFSSAKVATSARIYVSVKADTATFTGPGTTAIPVSKVSWTATAVGGGSASNGTLSSAAYTQVYQSPTNPKSGEVDMTWTLGSIAASGLRAGTHSLTVRWRLETF